MQPTIASVAITHVRKIDRLMGPYTFSEALEKGSSGPARWYAIRGRLEPKQPNFSPGSLRFLGIPLRRPTISFDNATGHTRRDRAIGPRFDGRSSRPNRCSDLRGRLPYSHPAHNSAQSAHRRRKSRDSLARNRRRCLRKRPFARTLSAIRAPTGSPQWRRHTGDGESVDLYARCPPH